jgi:NAD(P)-dependent dehydrogenase (short-subunit alcohol dehydrogenase family)
LGVLLECIFDITTVSLSDSHGNIGQTVYSASKSGLVGRIYTTFVSDFVGFTKSLAKELGSRNVLVNLIAPGYIDTGMTTRNIYFITV